MMCSIDPFCYISLIPGFHGLNIISSFFSIATCTLLIAFWLKIFEKNLTENSERKEHEIELYGEGKQAKLKDELKC